MITRQYATLADRRYLAKALALYDSLMKHSTEPFRLHFLAMCDDTEKILNELALPNVRVMSLSAFEHAMNLHSIRENRSGLEYFWTVASQLMEYLLAETDDEGITYIDADVAFFSDPKVIFDEIGPRSIGITPHRFSPAEELRLGKNGKFNVGIVVARNNYQGRKCITRWAAQVRARCSSAIGCGDQSYLDEWQILYQGACCVIENLGVNLGPWSLDHLVVRPYGDKDDLRPGVYDRNDTPLTGNPYQRIDMLNSFHFHELVDHKFLSGYPLSDEVLKYVYCPYLTALEDAKDKIRDVELKFVARKSEAERQWETA